MVIYISAYICICMYMYMYRYKYVRMYVYSQQCLRNTYMHYNNSIANVASEKRIHSPSKELPSISLWLPTSHTVAAFQTLMFVVVFVSFYILVYACIYFFSLLQMSIDDFVKYLRDTLYWEA